MSENAAAINIGRIKFLSEQNGPYEERLKERLRSMFDRIGGVAKAYLVRVSYAGGFDFGVVLATNADAKKIETIVPHISKLFSTIFSADQCLDIVLLNEVDETEAALVCKPFYVKLG